MATEGKSVRALGFIQKHCNVCAAPEWRRDLTRHCRRLLRPVPSDREAMRPLASPSPIVQAIAL